MNVDPTTTVTVGLAGLALGAFLAGLHAQRQMRKDYTAREDYDRTETDRDRRCEACDRRVADCVTKETLRLQLDPIVREQDHRRASMETLGKAVARTDRRLQRLELAITAIATKLGVEHPPEPEPES